MSKKLGKNNLTFEENAYRLIGKVCHSATRCFGSYFRLPMMYRYRKNGGHRKTGGVTQRCRPGRKARADISGKNKNKKQIRIFLEMAPSGAVTWRPTHQSAFPFLRRE